MARRRFFAIKSFYERCLVVKHTALQRNLCLGFQSDRFIVNTTVLKWMWLDVKKLLSIELALLSAPVLAVSVQAAEFQQGDIVPRLRSLFES